LNSLFYGLNIF